jgi:hypothetical protein
MNSVGLITRRVALQRLVRPKMLPLLLLAILMGCSTAGRFRSTKDESYDGKLERVLIVYCAEDTRVSLGRHFSERLVSHLTDLLGRQNVISESVQFDRSALDRSAPVKAAESRFQPRQVLYFYVTRMNSSSSVQMADLNQLPHFNNSMVVTLAFEIVDSKSDKTIWRTEVDYYSIPNPEQVAAALAESMRAAKLL